MDHPKPAFDVNDEAYISLTPVGCINAMFSHTDGEGRLRIPAWPCDNDDINEETTSWLDCVMTWDAGDRNNPIARYERLFAALRAIADVSDRLGDTREENKSILSGELLDVWDTYIRPFDLGDIDYDTVMDIEERMESAKLAADLAGLFEDVASDNGEEVFWHGEEASGVTAEEVALYDQYVAAVHADAERRLERVLAAYDVIIRAKRVCKLMSLNAPDIILNSEAKLLAQAMAINACAESVEYVSDAE